MKRQLSTETVYDIGIGMLSSELIHFLAARYLNHIDLQQWIGRVDAS